MVEGVEEPVSRELNVFSSDRNQLIEHWQEDSVGGVRELLFQSDDWYFATWLMLESYVDLIGNYSVDTATGKIELVNKGELRETEGFQGAGDFEIDEHGRLLLAGICPTEPDLENPD